MRKRLTKLIQSTGFSLLAVAAGFWLHAARETTVRCRP